MFARAVALVSSLLCSCAFMLAATGVHAAGFQQGAKLIRVDFIAAGDLLNWVLAKHGEKRQVQFVDAHRLVALFFGAMGINEHAKVQVRKN
jgi:hypothetical protein